ncbi:hypothetical protein ACFOWE_31655 [Planomonospora corallina]|uniref:Transposase DDE domain-containing protein n=1 Tax=Planomonospora corallina TaxID=1806052 RepID=A0ABV8IFH6_9ACTN
MVSTAVWFSVAYGTFLLLVAFALDLAARRACGRTANRRSGAFAYHADHDAWLCPQDQWLWPYAFDPHNRVMRYRARPAVCNSCPVKETCTTSDTGREVSRSVDPWPASEAERFHRGIACTVALLGVLWPLAVALGDRTVTERAVLAGTAALLAAGSRPLWSHLRRTTVDFPLDFSAEPGERGRG